jgi:hypothetical protein
MIVQQQHNCAVGNGKMLLAGDVLSRNMLGISNFPRVNRTLRVRGEEFFVSIE